MLLYRYKQRFVKVWKKLCEIKNRPSTTGRPVERRFYYAGLCAVTSFVRKKAYYPSMYGDYYTPASNIRLCRHFYNIALYVSLARDIVTGTKFPEINKKIEKLINKYKVFPDYHDIRQIVQICNMKYYDASFR